jgi:hypothetical protein
MDIEVEQITIIIGTNIPKKTNPDYLTKHIFYGHNSSYKDKFYEEFPFFTSSVKIPKDFLRRKSFDQKIMFFFNKHSFIETLSNKKNFYSIQESDKHKIIQYNLSTMIELLFTTVYPSVNNNHDSFNKMILKRGLNTLTLDGTVPNLFKSMIPSLNNDFSYIILDGIDYTVTSSCILNDVINHPEYNTMIHKIVELKKWKIQTKNEIESKITKLKKKIQFNIDNNFDTHSKIKYEFDKNKRNYSHYNSYPETDGKSFILSVLFNKLIEIIDFIDNIDNLIVVQDNEIRKDILNKIKTKINDKYSFQSVRYAIDKYTIDILKDIKTKFNDKYSFQTLRSLIDEVLMIYIIKLKFFDSKTSTDDDYDNDTYRGLGEYYMNDYSKQSSSKGTTDDYDVISGEIEKYFKQNYKKYSEVIDYVSNFIFPNRVTSNQTLQIMINDFTNNKNDLLVKFMTYAFNKYINNDNVSIAENYDAITLYTGVNSYNTVNNVGKLKYEAYVSFDLIVGKLTQDDLSNISCDYKDEELGTYFDSRRSDKLESNIYKPKLIERVKMIKNVIDGNTKLNGGKRNRRNTRKKKNVKRKTIKRKKCDLIR